MRYVIFAFFAGLILISLYSYVGLRFFGSLGLTPTWKLTAWVFLYLCPAFHILSLTLYLSGVTGRWVETIQWGSYLLLGYFSLIFPLVFLRDIFLLVLNSLDWALSMISPGNILSIAITDWSYILNISSLVILFVALIGCVVGFIQARKTPKVKYVHVPIKGLHPDLDGFRLLQITDIHAGPTIKKGFVKSIIKRANREQADVIVITGDLADGSVASLRDDVAPFCNLKATFGTYFVTGNHEYYSGLDQWVSEVKNLGMRPLMNEHVIIDYKEGKLLLAGVTDINGEGATQSKESSPFKAIEGAPFHHNRVLLAHQPRSLWKALEAGFDLQISGHTHGGQFIPWNFLIPLQQPITSGLKRVFKESNEMWVYVSRGAGYWGPPLRLGIPSEITVLKLKKA